MESIAEDPAADNYFGQEGKEPGMTRLPPALLKVLGHRLLSADHHREAAQVRAVMAAMAANPGPQGRPWRKAQRKVVPGASSKLARCSANAKSQAKRASRARRSRAAARRPSSSKSSSSDDGGGPDGDDHGNHDGQGRGVSREVYDAITSGDPDSHEHLWRDDAIDRERGAA